MRHKNYYSGTHGWTRRHNDYLPEPYTTFGSLHLEYKRPSMTRRYCKIIQWIADHPNRSRKEIIANIFLDKKWLTEHDEKLRPNDNRGRHWENGDFSWVTYNPSRYFAELLWSDMIDYDEKTFKYYVTKEGLELLEQAYLNDNIKLTTGKFPWQK